MLSQVLDKLQRNFYLKLFLCFQYLKHIPAIYTILLSVAFFPDISYFNLNEYLENVFQYMLDLPFQTWLCHCFNLTMQGLQK